MNWKQFFCWHDWYIYTAAGEIWEGRRVCLKCEKFQVHYQFRWIDDEQYMEIVNRGKQASERWQKIMDNKNKNQ